MPEKLFVEATKVSIGSRACSVSPIILNSNSASSEKRPKSAIVRGIQRNGTFIKKKSERKKSVPSEVEIQKALTFHKPGRSFKSEPEVKSSKTYRSMDALDHSVETLIGDHCGSSSSNPASNEEHPSPPSTSPLENEDHQIHQTDRDEQDCFTCSDPRVHIPQPMSVTIATITPRIELDNLDLEAPEEALDLSLDENRPASTEFFESRLRCIQSEVESNNEESKTIHEEEPHNPEANPDVDEGIGNLSDESPTKERTSGSRASILSSSCTLPVDFTPEPSNDDHTKEAQGYSDILSVLHKLDNEVGEINQIDQEPKPPETAVAEDTTTKKINDLFSYLDNVEEGTDSNLPLVESGRTQSAVPFLGSVKSTKNSISELLKESPQKLAEKVIKLRYKVEDTERAVTVLRDALEHQRKISANSTNKFQKELEQRLAQQKDEYEATIKRHQTFIDQLIEDKRSLSERCDVLHLDLRNSERKHQESIKSIEQRHQAELRRVKSLQETSSKIKQEKWMDEKTRRIKEQTVRGLEPEIQRLMSRHSSEMSDLESERERMLMSQEKELHQRHVQHVRELKALWDEEQHESLQRERQMLLQRHTMQLNEMAEQHDQEIQRLQEQLKRERERAIEDRRHFENEANQVRKIANERAQGEVERIKEIEENKRKNLLKKQAAELAAIKEAETAEREEWERNCRQKFEASWEENEKKLAAKFESEKNEKLTTEKARIFEEMKAFKDQCKRDLEEKICRMKAKQEIEIKDIDADNENMRKKVQHMRQELARLEEEAIVTKANFKQMEITINDLKKINAQLESERDDVRKAVRGEFNSALEALSTERNSLLNQISDLRLACTEMKSQKQVMERAHKKEMEREIENIHTRVKAAIAKKDEQIHELKQNFANALEQIEHLEDSLERNTKERILAPTKKK